MEATIAAEEPHLLDISYPDPDQAAAAITAARLRIARLSKAILQELHPRIDALDAAATRDAWTQSQCASRRVR